MPKIVVKPGETSEERFKRLAEARTQEVIHRIHILSKCANRQSYRYTPDQVERIFTALEGELRRVRERFEEQSSRAPEFKL